MPEGDTVYRAARAMHLALAGRVLRSTDFRVPQLATVDLSGRPVESVTSHGKHMFTRIGGDITLHTHFKMDGSWELNRAGKRSRDRRDHEIRIVLATDDWVAVAYRMPVVELLARQDEQRITARLGPDLLAEECDTAEAEARIRKDPDRLLRDALLDQSNLAGIGNLYLNELMFLRGLHPYVTVNSAGDIGALVQLSKRLLKANISSSRQSTTGSRRRGGEHWVFERPGKSCRRCNTLIQVVSVGGRPAYWCRRCQPAK